jgi:TRIAD3 protein (E3 ubiquitin-protein ligase RNF216)
MPPKRAGPIIVPESDSEEDDQNAGWVSSSTARFADFSVQGLSLSIVNFPRCWIAEVMEAKKKAVEKTELNPDGISQLLENLLKAGDSPSHFAVRLTQAGQHALQVQTNYQKDAQAFLAVAFPHLTQIQLDILVPKRHWLTDAVSNLRTESPPGQLFKISAHKKASASLAIQDPLVSLEIVALAGVLDDESRGGKCDNCAEFRPASQLGECDHHHRICSDCLVHEIEIFLGDGRTDFPCPAMHCGAFIPRASLLNRIPTKLFGKLVEIEAVQTIAQWKLPGVIMCCHCGCPVMFEGLGAMKCPTCAFETCSSCHRPMHSGCCSALSAEHQEEVEMTAEAVGKCPGCGSDFVKERGCNLMRCPVCRISFCHVCGELIPAEVGYLHFWAQRGQICPPGSCPLWTIEEGE